MIDIVTGCGLNDALTCTTYFNSASNRWLGSLLWEGRQNPLYCAEQRGDAEVKRLVIESNSIAPGKAPQSFRQVVSAAIVDRLTFASNILETGTDSYRLAHARAQRAAT
jgi:hypothetical protein